MAKVVEDKEDMLGLGLALEHLQGVGVAHYKTVSAHFAADFIKCLD